LIYAHISTRRRPEKLAEYLTYKDARSKRILAEAGRITPDSVKLNREATAVDR